MNLVFTAVMIAGLVVILILSPDATLSTLIQGSSKGLDFSIKIFSVYVVWLSVLDLWRKMNFDGFLAEKIKPILKKLFPSENDRCYANVAVNLSANLLGMGNAGTPAGINALSEMKRRQNKVMLLVVNATSIQLIPTTIVALRSAQGAQTDIILPTLLSTLLTTLIGAVLVKIFVK